MTRAARIDFFVRFGAAVLITLLLAPVVGWLFPHEKFHRILTRTFQAVFLVALIWPNPPRVWVGKLRELGVRGPGRLPRFFSGFALAALLFGLLLLVSWALGGRVWRSSPFPKSLASQILKACLIGVLVSLVEEVLFRGYLRRKMSGISSALIYALVHFLRPLNGSAPASRDFDPWLGFTRFGELLQGFTVLRNITLGVLSLFLIGMALNKLVERTGTLWAAVGVHAGLIFTVELYRRWFYDNPSVEWSGSNAWIFGGGRMHDGLLGCGMAALLWIIAAKAPLPRLLSKAGT